MVAEEFVGIEEMENCSGDGIDDIWQYDGEHIVTDPWQEWLLGSQSTLWVR